jgi:hypothetical protein
MCDDEQPLGLNPGEHIILHAELKDPSNDNTVKQIKRKYTPISTIDTFGYFDLLVKIYYPNPRFPNGGLMS